MYHNQHNYSAPPPSLEMPFLTQVQLSAAHAIALKAFEQGLGRSATFAEKGALFSSLHHFCQALISQYNLLYTQAAYGIQARTLVAQATEADYAEYSRKEDSLNTLVAQLYREQVLISTLQEICPPPSTLTPTSSFQKLDAKNLIKFHKSDTLTPSTSTSTLSGGSPPPPRDSPEHSASTSEQPSKKRKIEFEEHRITQGKGYEMLSRMGWDESKGLGKNEDGTTQPVPIELKADKKGLTSVDEQRMPQYVAPPPSASSNAANTTAMQSDWVLCRFNPLHKMPIAKLEKHEATCPDNPHPAYGDVRLQIQKLHLLASLGNSFARGQNLPIAEALTMLEEVVRVAEQIPSLQVESTPTQSGHTRCRFDPAHTPQISKLQEHESKCPSNPLNKRSREPIHVMLRNEIAVVVGKLQRIIRVRSRFTDGKLFVQLERNLHLAMAKLPLH